MRSLLLFLPLALLAADPATKPAAKKATVSAKAAPAAAASATMKNYKESGSPTAPITIEIYTDYQCPSCRAFYMDIMPQFHREYVATGKVRIVHRDFPLAMHPFSRTAAKFANAAGQIGRYELVMNQIFKTQGDWSQNGNIDGQVAKVLPPGEMQKVREIVAKDPRLNDTVQTDEAMGNSLRVNSTPTLEIIHKGRHQQIGGIRFEYPLLKSYIDQLLAKG